MQPKTGVRSKEKVKAHLKLVDKKAMPSPQANKPATPCVRNCCLDDTQVCLGCGRSLPEILEWHNADDIRQEQIISRANERLTNRKLSL